MKTFVVSLLLVLTVAPAFAQQIINTHFNAPSLDGQLILVRIYLPQGYSSSGPPFRLYVFLHGSSGNSGISCSIPMIPALNNKIGSGQIDPIVCVWPSAQGEDFSNLHMWTDSERYGDYERLVVDDLLNWLKSSGYNVSEARAQRAVGGFSMGGYGAVGIAVRNSEKFVAFISHGGPCALQELRNYVPQVIAEAPESEPPYTYDPANGPKTETFFGLSSAFSPNMTSPPWNLDFPLLSDGSVDESVFTDRWIDQHDPSTLIQNHQLYTRDVAMYFEAGTGDEYLPFSQRFDAELTALGVPHVFNTFDGGHVLLQSRVEVTLDWLDAVMDGAAADAPENETTGGQAELTIGPAHPNPARDGAWVDYVLGTGSDVRIQIIDPSGRRLTTLVNGRRPAGAHREFWDASQVASGVYLCRVQTESAALSRRIVIRH